MTEVTNGFEVEERRLIAWARRQRKRGPAACPECRSSDIRPLILGMPAPWVMGALSEGLVEVGGCMIGYPGGDPEFACGQCGYWMRKDGSGFPGESADADDLADS